jgi:hypothetical protein
MISAHDAGELLQCGCLVMLLRPGHTQTKLCAAHRQEAFESSVRSPAAVLKSSTPKPEWDDL